MEVSLSIIIVNYNVRFFLEQCIYSIRQATKQLNIEIFVVDNYSSDDSVAVIQSLFPDVKVIANTENVGFSKANNQALKMATGKYVLFLNPDTLLSENTLSVCFDFMNQNPNAGACGVRHLNGNGNYLPESKRGLPTPWVSFCKMSGLGNMFPKSKTFSGYYLGHLDATQTQTIEVLSGAFMYVRKLVLDEIGGFDERFFMYGEDIDLSYRITQSNHTIHYLPQSSIIHYKGESTKKQSRKYVNVFYNAMTLFAEKHFSKAYARSFFVPIQLAIFLKTIFLLVKKGAKSVGMPLLDAGIIFVGMYFLKNYWATMSKIYYPYEFIRIAVPLYILIWISSVWLNGGYDRPFRYYRILRGIITGVIFILLVYALLPEAYRYSRFLLLIGSVWAGLVIISSKAILNGLLYGKIFPEQYQSDNILIVASENEKNRIEQLIAVSGRKPFFIGRISPFENDSGNFLGYLPDLKNRIVQFQISEVIFSDADLSINSIFDHLEWLSNQNISLRIAPHQSEFIISKSEIDTSETWFKHLNDHIGSESNRRKKRMVDLIIAFLLLLFSPLILFKINGRFWIKNALNVALGKKTWIGYINQTEQKKLPLLKLAVFELLNAGNEKHLNSALIHELNYFYVRQYSAVHDFGLVLNQFLNRKPKTD